MEAVVLLLIVASIVLFWQDSLKNRELVIKHCKKLCSEANLQLLDQTVSLNSIKIRNKPRVGFVFVRLYEFHVSKSGTERMLAYLLLQQGIVEHAWIVTNAGNIILQQDKKTPLH